MAKSILLLHGITMSGRSMVQTMGPFADQLRDSGYELIAPNGGFEQSTEDVEGALSWIAPLFARHGLDIHSSFCDGNMWSGHEHYDWLRWVTDPATGGRTAEALERSVEVLSDALADKELVGVIGFSQGAALATLLEAMKAQGDTRLPEPRFGIYVAGGAGQYVGPFVPRYPIRSRGARMLLIGERDPMCDDPAQSLANWSAAFEGGEEVRLLVEDLGHEMPTSPATVSRMMDFVRRHSA